MWNSPSRSATQLAEDNCAGGSRPGTTSWRNGRRSVVAAASAISANCGGNRTNTSMQRLAVVTRSCGYSLFSTWPVEEVWAGRRRGR